MNIEIRRITVDDANEMQLLSKQLGYEMSLNDTIEQIKEILCSESDFAAVAFTETKIIGWIHVFKAVRLETKPFAEIGGLVVDENYRSKGIGRQLVDGIRPWCQKKGIIEVRVRSNVKRKEAHQFYRSVGFSELKEQKVFQLKL